MARETERKMNLAALDVFLEYLEEFPDTASSKNRVLDDLAFLKAFLMDPPQRFVEDNRLKDLESLASEVESFFSRLDLNNIGEDKTVELFTQLFELLMPVRDRKYEVRLIYKERPKPSRFYYPRTGQLMFIDHLVENLEEMVKDTDSSTRPLKHLILRVQQKLQLWSSRFMKALELPNQQFITNLAYEVEYSVDSFLAKDFPIWHCMFLLIDLLEEFEQGDMETRDDDNDLVGFVAEGERLLESLVGGSMELNIISIVDPARQGKTTLAKKLFTERRVVSYFNARAWCCISQVYERRGLLLELLGQLVLLREGDYHMDDAELAAKLHEHLKGQRFLIFLDDIWSIDAWNDLCRYFPDDRNGSRIMFTTRTEELAYQAKFDSILQPDSMLQPLSLLSDDTRWKLLEKKVFQKECCPPELSHIGRKIAQICKGLPLPVNLIAGLLAKMEKKVDQWVHIAESLSSLDDSQEESKGAIELIYNNLPDHLKPCFLYFGARLKDERVPVKKLIRLWIAEGFIKFTYIKSLEDVAMDYLRDLIERRLVSVAQKASSGGVKSCHVDNLLHDFCLIKAREENFMQQINGIGEHHSYSSTPTIYYLSRLFIYFPWSRSLEHCGSFVRSMLLVAANDMRSRDPPDVSFIFHKFKYLRILDLEDIIIGNSFEAIVTLDLLRYLAVQVYADSIPIPSTISNLWNLETFLIKVLNARVVNVPDSIWDMAKLRHVHINWTAFDLAKLRPVHINWTASFDLKPHILEKSSVLENLQTFSTPFLTYGDNMEKIMRKLNGLRKLKCIFLDSWDDARNCNKFPLLESLNQLVSLKVFYEGEGKQPREFNFPSNLKKLTLSNFRMPWNEMLQLSTLHNLEVLKLLDDAFEGETWEMEDEVFPKLKFLKLYTLNVSKWSALPDHFPCLERLVLQNCRQLEEIPPNIGDIPTLQMIEVMWCSRSVGISAKKIQEKQSDCGNERLKIELLPEGWY